ncbi:MAG: DNA recombination protein RmuC [Campylobacter sp.]
MEIYIFAVVGVIFLIAIFLLSLKNAKLRTQNEILSQNFAELNANFTQISRSKNELENALSAKSQSEISLKSSLNQTEQKLENTQISLEQKSMQISNLSAQIAVLEEKERDFNANFTKHFAKIEQDRLTQKSEILKSFDMKFAEISAKILNENSQNMAQTSQNIIKNTLENQLIPLKNEIEKYQKQTSDLNTIFRANFDGLKDQTQNILREASNLADALKNNKKSAGNWGEIQLDRVLESSGLILGENYQKQVVYNDENGSRKIIDALVFFDEKKRAIIDAKCSLVNFTAFYNANSDSERAEFARNLARDIKNHIDTFASKNYGEYSGTFEYVFMFIPNENILSTALNADFSLYQYGYEKGIFITTPLTLLMALKTIYICWKNLKSDENAMKIFDESSKLLDKISDFLSSFEKVQNNVNTLNSSLETAAKQLFSGRGNIVKRCENLSLLGAKNSKKIELKNSANLSSLGLDES